MESVASVLRALFGYFFLVFIVRIVGRRPGKQLTPFEFILIFFLGGLMLTAIVAQDSSVTNAFLPNCGNRGRSLRSNHGAQPLRHCCQAAGWNAADADGGRAMARQNHAQDAGEG